MGKAKELGGVGVGEANSIFQYFNAFARDYNEGDSTLVETLVALGFVRFILSSQCWQPMSSGATCWAGRQKKDWGRRWEGLVAMGVAWVVGDGAYSGAATLEGCRYKTKRINPPTYGIKVRRSSQGLKPASLRRLTWIERFGTIDANE